VEYSCGIGLDKVHAGCITYINICMSDLVLDKIDAVNMKIECDDSIAKELNMFFTFAVPNYQYTPAYKNKKWDGMIRLFNLYSRRLYIGLYDYLKKFAEDRNLSIEVNFDLQEKPELNIEEFISSLDLNGIVPHDYQLSAINYVANKQRCLLLSPTGSGKSLIIYILLRFYLEQLQENQKILIVVPTTGLVSQMYNDFKSYSGDGWDVSKHCHVIFSGQDKVTEKPVVISTWQSIYKLPPEYFESYSVVFGDECHLFKAKSLTSLMSKLSNAEVRIGTTGTLDGTQVHKLVIEGLFGRVHHVTTTKKLIDTKILSKLDIDCLVLQYSDSEKAEIKRAPYIDEIKWLIGNEKRNKFISTLCKNITGNTLLLFNYVELHGKPLYELIQKVCPDRKVFFIHGGTDVEQREQIRQIVDNEQEAILVASYGTCSTGINIRNINNIVFTSPSKSVVRVLQSIGRGLRKSDKKDSVKLYDIADNLSHKKYKNHTLRHLDERIKIYTNESFSYKLIPIKL
jgi:superfamily II DNA or RNA helicase